MVLPLRSDFDVCIGGSGPAGLALAAACCELGLRTAVVAPQPRARWPNNYGMWIDDAEALGVEALAQRWARSEVVLAGQPLDLGRGYARLDHDRLQHDWLAAIERGGELVDARVESIEHGELGTGIETSVGKIAAGRFIDATGHRSSFVEREAGPPPGFQVAWGEVHEHAPSERAGTSAEVMRFMDWTPSPAAAADGLPPSFLYCMPMADGRVFVEETVLVGRPSGDPAGWLEPLRARLHARLPSIAGGASLLETERCIIAMGVPLPRPNSPTLAFGSAASFVHPATGYMLTVALRRVPRVAQALVDARALPGALGHAAIEAAIWTADERRAWALYGFGMEVLLELDHAGVEAFFTEFFRLAPERWRAFLSASAPAPSLMATMLRYFAVAPPRIRRRLAAHLFGRDGVRMTRGLL